MKPRTRIARISQKKLASLGGRYPGSTAKRSSKQIKKVNPKAKAKRVRGYRKMLAGKEYRVARAEAFERARNQCELWLSWTDVSYASGNALPFLYTGTTSATTTHVQRCPEILDLHAHHKKYPKGRKLTASDLTICCKPHHTYLESLKPHKTRMF